MPGCVVDIKEEPNYEIHPGQHGEFVERIIIDT
jgi:hypothetical protein